MVEIEKPERALGGLASSGASIAPSTAPSAAPSTASTASSIKFWKPRTLEAVDVDSTKPRSFWDKRLKRSYWRRPVKPPTMAGPALPPGLEERRKYYRLWDEGEQLERQVVRLVPPKEGGDDKGGDKTIAAVEEEHTTETSQPAIRTLQARRPPWYTRLRWSLMPWHRRSPPSWKQLHAFTEGPGGILAFQQHKFRRQPGTKKKKKKKQSCCSCSPAGARRCARSCGACFRVTAVAMRQDCFACIPSCRPRPGQYEGDLFSVYEPVPDWVQVEIIVGLVKWGKEVGLADDQIKWLVDTRLHVRDLVMETEFEDTLWLDKFCGVRETVRDADGNSMGKRVRDGDCRKNWYILITLLLAVVLIGVLSLYNEKIAKICHPFVKDVRAFPVSWIYPIIILVILSIPPLAGQEIVGLLAGMIWGLWVGFAIMAAGTFLGEIMTWFLFKGLFIEESGKSMRKNSFFSSMARLTNIHGFPMVVLLRVSLIPSHITTAIFAMCGFNFWGFCLATAVSLVKQLVLVYFGVIVMDESNSTNKAVTAGIDVSLVVVTAGTLWLAREMMVIRGLQRERYFNLRQEKLLYYQNRGDEEKEVAIALGVDPEDAEAEAKTKRDMQAFVNLKMTRYKAFISEANDGIRRPKAQAPGAGDDANDGYDADGNAGTPRTSRPPLEAKALADEKAEGQEWVKRPLGVREIKDRDVWGNEIGEFKEIVKHYPGRWLKYNRGDVYAVRPGIDDVPGGEQGFYDDGRSTGTMPNSGDGWWATGGSSADRAMNYKPNPFADNYSKTAGFGRDSVMSVGSTMSRETTIPEEAATEITTEAGQTFDAPAPAIMIDFPRDRATYERFRAGPSSRRDSNVSDATTAIYTGEQVSLPPVRERSAEARLQRHPGRNDNNWDREAVSAIASDAPGEDDEAGDYNEQRRPPGELKTPLA